ncbi:MAG TPA: imidazole glycerol phosphate synthase subunit HisH [Gemmatimonadaceae bacterium]|nr:imidazole glycerol phosphate synthase subunit HisH [Gemmatimonadaceae bacterium]
MRLAIFDYGAGNLHSLNKALQAPGVIVSVETDPLRLLSADAMILPGVGAFGAAAARLAPARAEIAAALSAGLPCLGICLGLQLLFESSEESPGAPGLGIISGQVRRLRASRVPHIGWNTVDWGQRGAPSVAYFAHSYACRPHDEAVVTAWTVEGEDRFPSAVRWRNVVGVQFHPEKSSAPGVCFLQDFLGAV